MSEQTHPLWNHFIRVVQEEVKPALGCTEPVSLALACAIAAEQLPGDVTKIEAWVSPNLMKNGLGVTVPGTGMVGLPIAAALGAIGGNEQAGLEVLKDVTADALARAKAMLNAGLVQVKLQEPCDEILYSRACVYAGEASAMVTIAGGHTRVVEVVCQGETRFSLDERQAEVSNDPLAVLSNTTLSQILEFVEQVPFEAIRFILEAGQLNDALSREGLSGKWGLHIGTTLNKQRARGWMAQDLGSDIVIRTSAASDARMGGATLP
ncbi:serine dehydratase subunit alpha family protein, partial [Enterobacter cloacae complex sp. P12RS]